MKKSKRLENLTFKKLENVSNPRSIHGIYPYRGKLSAIDASQIINQLPDMGVLLDPFCGSGTVVYEAKKHGLNVIGVDSNPLAVQITKAKFCLEDISSGVQKIKRIISEINLNIKKEMSTKARRYFHKETANQIMHMLAYYDEFNDYEKAAFLGAICLSVRGCNNYNWSSTQIGRISEEKKYINFFDKFLNKIKKHSYSIGSEGAEIILGDTRKLSKLIPSDSVDFVYTSPPYFDCLDYTSNYTRIIHYIFENDITMIKSKLIQKFDDYEGDIRRCFEEIVKVTKEDALIIFVVGDKKKGKEIINGGEFFSDIYEKKPNLIKEREYTGTASKIWDKINKTQRKEQIVVWDRSTW